MTDRRRPVLVSDYEIATDAALAEVATRVGYRVFAKVRVADALDIDRSGLSNEQFHYALSAHFDFVVADVETSRSLFAVEFDGRQHQTSRATAARDRMKDAICAKLELPLLRIDAAFLQQVDRFTIVGYLVELYSLSQAFYAAQESGQIPMDEDFDYWSVIETSNGRLVQPYDLAAPAKRLIWALAEAGEIDHHTYSHATLWQPDPETHRHVAYAWVKVQDDVYLLASAAIRTFELPGILPWDLAEQMAVRSLHQRLLRYKAGDDVAITGHELDELISQTDTPGWGHGGVVEHVNVPGLRTGRYADDAHA